MIEKICVFPIEPEDLHRRGFVFLRNSEKGYGPWIIIDPISITDSSMNKIKRKADLYRLKNYEDYTPQKKNKWYDYEIIVINHHSDTVTHKIFNCIENKKFLIEMLDIVEIDDKDSLKEQKKIALDNFRLKFDL